MMSYCRLFKNVSNAPETITAIMLDRCTHFFTFIRILYCTYMITIQIVNRNDGMTSYFVQNETLRAEIDKINETNAEISDQISALDELYIFLITCPRLRRYLAQYILRSIVNKS